MDTIDIQKIIEKNNNGLISILQDIQSHFGFLPEEALRKIAELTNHSLVDIYGVATFYKSFSLTARGKHLASVCVGTACHVRGGNAITEEFEKQFGIKAGETTDDDEFTLETVNCLGACALGPIVVIDGHYFSNVKLSDVKEIINKVKNGLDMVEISTDKRIFPMEIRCPKCNHSWMDPEYLINDYPSIRVTVSFMRKHGWLRLSSLYGVYSSAWEHEPEKDTIVNIFCQHCHSEIVSASNCNECRAPMLPMIIQGGGIISICSRYGCKSHMLDVSGINQ